MTRSPSMRMRNAFHSPTGRSAFSRGWLGPFLLLKRPPDPAGFGLGVPDLHLRRAAEVEAAVPALLDLPVGEQLEVGVVALRAEALALSVERENAVHDRPVGPHGLVGRRLGARQLLGRHLRPRGRVGDEALPALERAAVEEGHEAALPQSIADDPVRPLPRGGIGQGGLGTAEDRVRLVAGQPGLLGRLPRGEVEEGGRGRVAPGRVVEVSGEEPQRLGLAHGGHRGEHGLLRVVLPGKGEELLVRGELLHGRRVRPADEADVALDRRAELLPVPRARGDAQELLGRRVVRPPGEGRYGGGLDLGVLARGRFHGRTKRPRPADPRQDLQDRDLPGGRRVLQQVEEAVGPPLGIRVPQDRRRDRFLQANDVGARAGLLQHRDETREVGVPGELAQGRERGFADGGVGVFREAVDALDLAARPLLAEDVDEDGLGRERGDVEEPGGLRDDERAGVAEERPLQRGALGGVRGAEQGQQVGKDGLAAEAGRGGNGREAHGLVGAAEALPERRAGPRRPGAGRASRGCRRGRRTARRRPSRPSGESLRCRGSSRPGRAPSRGTSGRGCPRPRGGRGEHAPRGSRRRGPGPRTRAATPRADGSCRERRGPPPALRWSRPDSARRRAYRR